MKIILSSAAFLGLISIILGAFGAHTLKEILDSEALKSFDTGVRYMMYHVITILIVSTYSGFSVKNKKIISYLFFLGIAFFSGSIFAITVAGISAKSIWFITPLGGLFFIVGWLKMVITFLKNDAG